jgi:hypothetical protein
MKEAITWQKQKQKQQKQKQVSCICQFKIFVFTKLNYLVTFPQNLILLCEFNESEDPVIFEKKLPIWI